MSSVPLGAISSPYRAPLAPSPVANRGTGEPALLIAPVGRALAVEQLVVAGAEVELRRVHGIPLADMLDPHRPTVVLLDRSMLLREASAGEAREALRSLAERAALLWVGDSWESEPPPFAPSELLTGWLAGGGGAAAQAIQIKGAFRHAAALVAARRAGDDEAQRMGELTELARVGAALATERDLQTLLELILSQARRITGCDAGSLYLVDDGDAERATLRFRLAQNHSLPLLELREFAVPVDDTSLAGYAALTGEPLVIEDAYALHEGASYRQNRSFDELSGYRTKSMLVVPMKSQRGDVVGVLQLINRKRTPSVVLDSAEAVEREVLPFDAHAVVLGTAIAAQAGVAIENGRLYEDIERLFEGFVTAAVTAIEARDPATSGHSARVAQLTVGLAQAVDRGGTGRYRDVRFSREQLRELRYAGLLHDVGKVGVREQVLVKEKKLYEGQIDVIRHRFALARRDAELEFERARAEHLRRCGAAGYDEAVARLRALRDERQAELAHFLEAVTLANEPTVLPEGTFGELEAVRRQTYVDPDGREQPLLGDDELRYLMVRQGTLDERERREIESHVTHTYRFLEQIPWTRELRGIPSIAYAHHEKLNGTGYPRAVSAEEIPVQARMMTIADIYDALTASDRPYKRAVPQRDALDILHDEARAGMLDAELLETFVQSGVWRAVGRPE